MNLVSEMRQWMEATKEGRFVTQEGRVFMIGGPGAGGGGSGGSGAGSAQPLPTHTVPLPKNPKRVTMQQTAEALAQMGLELGKPTYDHVTKKTSYLVSLPGQKPEMFSAEAIREIVYAQAEKD